MQGTRLMPSTRRQSRKTLGNAKVSTGPVPTDQRIDDIFRSRRRAKLPSKAAAKQWLQESVRQADTQPKEVAKPRKRKKKSKPKIATSKEETSQQPVSQKATIRKYHSEVQHDGSTYCVGDSAYVALEVDEGLCSDEELEVCEICEKTHKKKGRREVPLLECETCLRGYHLDCISPPLAAVPEGEWHCQYCATGQPLPPRKVTPNIAREKFFSGKWGLVRIEALWSEDDGEVQFSGRWYHRPEDVHTGRQKHHGAREVFLTSSVDNNSIDCLERTVPVCMPSAAHQFGSHPDVYTCEYEYDSVWKRFKRLSQEDLEQADADWAASSDSESDEENVQQDRNFKPIYAFWAEKGLIQSKNMRQSKTKHAQAKQPLAANKARKVKTQGGEDWIQEKGMLGLGASQIPEELRKQSELTDLDKARRVLALTAAPKSLACRESERETISGFVRETVQAGSEGLGRCLYVSGVPGTGKTATVLEVMRSLRREVDAGQLPSFQFVEMNSLRLPSPQHAYTQLYEALTGQHLSPAVALGRLEDMFDGKVPKRQQPMTIILADEIDMLVTRNQQVLYNLFEWPTRHSSRLAMVAVANTMDLPERLLPRIASRLGGRRLVFQPYNRPQLITIVSQRLEDAGLSHTIASNAINMACSKVAGVSGDVRRVLQLCRKAAEICQEEAASQVAMRHINLGVEQMFSAAHMQLLTSCCPLEKLVLASLVLETKAQGRCDAVMEDVVFRLQQIAEVRNLQGISFGDCVNCCRKLGAKRLILAEQGGKRLWMRISLNVPQDDVVEVLQQDAAIVWLKDLNY